MVLAGCGLIYEYIFSHYAGRVLGSLETVLFSIIGIMIVSMGIGSFLAARIKDAFVAVSILESLIAITAIAGIYIISGTYSLAFELPKIIADTYQLSQTNPPRGYLVHYAENILEGSAYIMAAIIGVLIGMEIPLVARIRQSFHQQHLEHNTGTVYGVDYIGAGLGAFLWVIVMIKQEISTSIAIVASINIVAGYGFIMVFSRYIKRLKLVITVQVVSTFIVYFGASNIGEWQSALEQSLYAKPIVVSKNTDHQRLVITEGRQPYTGEVTYDLYLNGQIQFSQQDEHIYHSLLVYPPMLLVNNPKNVLIIGGGDGLALRDVLKFPVDKVTLVDFDKGLVSYFKEVGVVESDTFLALNEYAFSDPRVQLVIDDAFSTVHKLMAAGKLFDAIIIDLPDPSHPDLNKLYSKQFFKAIKNILNSEGAFSIQSTSPYYAKPAFLSIKKTIEAAGFETVEQYQQNVPSFGQWGWSVATKKPTAILDRFEEIDMFPVPNKWLTPKLMRASFEFPKDFYSGNENIKINEIGSGIIYQYYQEAWVEQTRYYLF
jgi:spermidine synthase